MKDYYKVLGVEPGADIAQIKKVYRKLARENHPDLHPGDKQAEERFKDIGEAWEILGDEQKRAKYDAEQQKGPRVGRRTPTGPVNYADVMSQFDTFFGKATQATDGKVAKNPLDGSDMFNSFMKRGMGKK